MPPTKDGFKHTLAMVDSVTHFTILTATKDIGAKEVERHSSKCLVGLEDLPKSFRTATAALREASSLKQLA
jgi:hypothetical protein